MDYQLMYRLKNGVIRFIDYFNVDGDELEKLLQEQAEHRAKMEAMKTEEQKKIDKMRAEEEAAIKAYEYEIFGDLEPEEHRVGPKTRLIDRFNKIESLLIKFNFIILAICIAHFLSCFFLLYVHLYLV
jgi:hypothetical protein